MAMDEWTPARVAEALVGLLEEPFATSEDVGLDVRRVELAEPGPSAAAPGVGRIETVEIDLADGATFRLAVERLG